MENIDPKMGERIFLIIWKKIKGAFVFLGSGNGEKVMNQPGPYSSGFILDEDVLYMGPALFLPILHAHHKGVYTK